VDNSVDGMLRAFHPASYIALNAMASEYDPRTPLNDGGVMIEGKRRTDHGARRSYADMLLPFVALAFMLLAGCAGAPYPPAPGMLASVDYNYHIGPSDVVNVIVWRNPELSASVPVRPDGRITTPLVDDLDAQGKSPTELARDMEKALAKYIRDPVVTVIVTAPIGPPNEQVRVIGEAAKPQVMAFRKGMTVMDVMIAAGGLTDFADGNAARIFRASDGGKIYSVRLRDLIKGGDINANVDMRPGDVLIIPQGWF
jgi:polysaccharide export outer membrane protein